MSQNTKIIEELAKKYNISDENEVTAIIKAIFERKDELVEEIFSKKKWKEFKDQYQQISSRPSIYLRYPLKHLQIPLENKNSNYIKCIIFGPCGNGKTTVINSLCGTNLPSGISQSSLTRDIIQIKCKLEQDPPLVLYDSPGTNSHKDKIMHAALVKQLFEHAPINCLLILVKYQNRTDELLTNIFKQVRMVKGYEKNILFLITHFDLITESPQVEIQKIENLINKLLPNFKNQIIFFSNKFVKPTELSNTIYRIAKSLRKITMTIDTETFLKFYNIEKSVGEELFFKNSENQAIQQMDETAEDYIKYAKNLVEDNERDAIFQDIQIPLKGQLEELIDQFARKNNQTMLHYEYYETFYRLQLRRNQLLNKYKETVKALQNHTNVFESQATGSQLDIRDLIKKCPNPQCGLVWFRIQRCPNTTCGNRPSCVYDYKKKPFSRYRVWRDKIKRNVNREKIHVISALNPKVIGSQQNQKKIKQAKGLGCGQAMNFELLPKLQNIDSLLMTWLGKHTIEEVIYMFQNDPDLQKKRMQIEEKARQSTKRFQFW